MKTNETEKAEVFWMKHEEGKVETQTTLKNNETGIYKWRGRVQGHYPVYIPRK